MIVECLYDFDVWVLERMYFGCLVTPPKFNSESPWKMIIGRRSLPFSTFLSKWSSLFRGRTVKLWGVYVSTCFFSCSFSLSWLFREGTISRLWGFSIPWNAFRKQKMTNNAYIIPTWSLYNPINSINQELCCMEPKNLMIFFHRFPSWQSKGPPPMPRPQEMRP